MKQVHILTRLISSTGGESRMVIPVRAFDKLETAQEAQRARHEMLADALRVPLFVDGVVANVTVRHILHELGIGNIEHYVATAEVHAGELLEPQPPSIIIPGR